MKEVYIVTRILADWSKSTFAVLHEVVRSQILGVYETEEEARDCAIKHHPEAKVRDHNGRGGRHCIAAWDISHDDVNERRMIYKYKVGQRIVK